jgi:protoheme IX farnesyltransferase
MAGYPTSWGWSLFALIFCWQFPHFMAIAWLWREDYRRGGLRMLPAEPGAERLAGRTALVHAALLVPVSLVPGLIGAAGLTFTLGVLALGLGYLALSARFAWRQEHGSARALLLGSLAYLPMVLLLAVLDPTTGAQDAFR